MARRTRSLLAPARAYLPRYLGAALGVGFILLTAGRSLAQDHQVFALGLGARDAACVDPGPDTHRNSTPAGDDTIQGDFVLSGPNGICETPLGGDDVRPATGITLGKGLPNGGLIIAGRPGNNNGICNDVITPLGDDVVHVPPGQSEPRQVAVYAGTNGVINSTPGGDDVSTAVICPGNDLGVQSTVNPADQLVTDNSICRDLCSNSSTCIIPGTDDVLQSTADPQDVMVFYVSSGANGISETTAAGDDTQGITVGSGFTEVDTVCVTSGPDGIAQTTLCGNGVNDSLNGAQENGIPPPNTVACDDGGTTAGDGCSSTCTVETGWTCSGQPSVCTPICGDGLIRGGELCDDGNTNTHDNCTNACQPAACGDGIVKSAGAGPNEQCDDGNLVSGDGCDANCKITACGNGIVTAGELCDDGNLTNGDGCDANCTPTGCGNGIVTAGEQCDDGNTSNLDGCLNNCQLATCGDGFVRTTAPAEQCDDGNLTNGDGCDANCTPTGCGNGIVTAGEQCDDGNLTNGDGCDANCTPTGCGNGIVTAGELCDDGNLTNGDGCDANCTPTGCGNGIVTAGEQCDDGNTVDGDCCSATCQTDPNGMSCNDGNACTIADQCVSGVCQGNPMHCGDGVIQGGACGEQCDDGNTAGGDGCGPTCKTEFCGDGIVNNNGTEECDDGNNRNNDACVQGCRKATCGDGFRQSTLEECDDGNLVAGDGCSPLCTIERPPRCGNGVVDGACSQGTVAAPCAINTDCDTSLGAGDGVCVREECDDGNNSNRDDCLNSCRNATCGDGFVHDKGGGGEECDDGNTTPGDGCSASCKIECGNGVIDGACSQGTLAAACATNADCDTSVGAGDGVCVGEACDPGKGCSGGANDGVICTAGSECPGGLCTAKFCLPDVQVCSNVCQIATCGNGEEECTEECDLGALNGVPGSGCTAACRRNLVGADELTRPRLECPSAWTLDSAPQDLGKRTQICTDGAACDFDTTVNGQCIFHVGVCLNRPVPGCASVVRAFDLTRLKFVGRCAAGRVGRKCSIGADCETAPNAGDGTCVHRNAEAAATITAAVSALAPGTAKIADRCRVGLRGKVCSIPDDDECDRTFGAGTGRCDIGAGVEFLPPLEAASQIVPCTPSFDVVVQAGSKLKLRANVSRTGGSADKDALTLICRVP